MASISRQPRYIFMLLLLMGLMLADASITQFLISTGLAYEGNPLLRGFLTAGNFMWVKITGGMLSALVLWDISRRYLRIASITSLIFIVVYTVIVYWNMAAGFITVMHTA